LIISAEGLWAGAFVFASFSEKEGGLRGGVF